MSRPAAGTSASTASSAISSPSIGDEPPVNFCRPAVDVLFPDAARHLGPPRSGLVLTGMGSDGTDGAGALRRAGAAVMAQDEATQHDLGHARLRRPGPAMPAPSMPLDGIGTSIRSLVPRGELAHDPGRFRLLARLLLQQRSGLSLSAGEALSRRAGSASSAAAAASRTLTGAGRQCSRPTIDRDSRAPWSRP